MNVSLIMDNNIRKQISRKKDYFSEHILKWSEKNSPEYPWRETIDPYNVMISEMLLRRTRASSVILVYGKFLEKFPDVFYLAKSSVKDIEVLIKSLGMKSRSSRIKYVAELIVKKYSGIIPSEESDLLDVIGKGSLYTVNAIRCFGLNEKVAIFDVNVKRILERVFSINFGKDAHKKKSSWDIASMLVPEKNVKQYNWALLDLGKSVCTGTNPKCSICPLKTICDYV